MSEAVCAVLDYGFNKLGLTLISANCYPQNKRSQRVLEKMGFTYEGILHQAEVSYDDKIYDHLCYYLEEKQPKIKFFYFYTISNAYSISSLNFVNP